MNRPPADTVKHTPGPWALAHPYGEVQEGCEGAVICEVDRLFGAPITVRGTKAEMKTVDGHDWEATANARLIAAAPDLLEALKGQLSDIEDYQRVNNLGGENNHWQVIARAAITKAEGRS